MRGCLAPSEIPGISRQDASAFGEIAEELIYADFCTRYPRVATQVFRDAYNPSGFLYFLTINNPQFTRARQLDFYVRLRTQRMMYVPDFMVHTATEKAFYEVKPESRTGMSAGVQKVGTLGAVFPSYGLPYVAGSVYSPRDHVVGRMGPALEVRLRVRRVAPGLLVYALCLRSDRAMDMATLALLLRYLVLELNKQRGSGSIRPVDLTPLFTRNVRLDDLARSLGIPIAGAAAGAAAGIVGWRYFWRAVARRFAVRGSTALVLAAADGPLPVGDLIAAGLALWTIVDIVRLHDELWRDARVIRDASA